jgi:hypothetical protein
MEPGDYYGAPTTKVLRFIRSAGFIMGLIRRRGSTIELEVRNTRAE